MKYLTSIQIKELAILIKKAHLREEAANRVVKAAQKVDLPFDRLKELIEVAPEYEKLSDYQIGVFIKKAQKRHLTIKQVEALGACCNDDEFIETVDDYIGVLKAGISANDLRLKPCGVQKELDRLRKVFNDLSTDARFHLHYLFEMQFIRDDRSRIDDEGVTHIEGDNALQKIDRILRVPYSRLNKVNLQRQGLMHFIRVLNNTYGPKPYDDTGRLPKGDEGERIQPGDLERVAIIICKAAGMGCGKSIVRQALRHDDLKPPDKK